MNRSDSKPALDEMLSLKESGKDLSEYTSQMTRERNSRTLSLRRMNRPTISGTLGLNLSGISAKKSHKLDLPPKNAVSTEESIVAFQSNNPTIVIDYCRKIVTAGSESRMNISGLLKDEDFIKETVHLLSNEFPNSVIIGVLELISYLFPLSGDKKNIYIDEDLCFSFYNFLGSDDIDVVKATMHLIGTISSSSTYARDSILNFEFYENLCTIASSSNDESVVSLACESLRLVFSQGDEIDYQILSNAVSMLVPLLDLGIVSAVQSIIAAMTEMSCKMTTLVITFGSLGIFPRAVQFLSVPELVGVTLKLVGNLSNGQPSHVKSMIDCGLFEILIELIHTDYSADVFWILSNLIESIGSIVIPRFDVQFISEVINIFNQNSTEVKKESSFFLSTLILFLEVDSIHSLVSIEIIDILVEMIGCGHNMVIIRCIDSIVRIIHLLQIESQLDDFISMIDQTDLEKRLKELLYGEKNVISDRAEYLLSIIE